LCWCVERVLSPLHHDASIVPVALQSEAPMNRLRSRDTLVCAEADFSGVIQWKLSMGSRDESAAAQSFARQYGRRCDIPVPWSAAKQEQLLRPEA
jgi:hypothetical protein